MGKRKKPIKSTPGNEKKFTINVSLDPNSTGTSRLPLQNFWVPPIKYSNSYPLSSDNMFMVADFSLTTTIAATAGISLTSKYLL